MYCFFFCFRVIEDNEEKEELSEVEEKNHVKSGKTQAERFKEKSQEIFHLHSVVERDRHANNILSFT